MKITIRKYNPGVDAAPHDVEYDVEYHDHMTVLEACVWINENVERLAFDFNCRGRACGRCAMMLDGEPMLACVTMLDDASHTIEPQEGFPVLRDLIVDKSVSLGELALRYNRVRSAPITEEEANTHDMSVHKVINGLEWCCRCLNCQVVCPAHNADPATYAGPAMMLATAFRFYDPYDQGDRVLEAVNYGLWNCIMCGKCTEVCEQREIDHLAIWKDLRAAAVERGFTEEKFKVKKTDGSLVYAPYISDPSKASGAATKVEDL